ncbi:D-alanine--D-alanine ligase family protein [Actinomyces vulturis]|uniref:D-alanine--D-alanine ligase family protein n=1 Tax=Actinomyces vulturis TaxID=1857645 RepID=UPI00082DBB80|nr:D-alanine--D-alanine ligase family protein [Actinomyces vulturis]
MPDDADRPEFADDSPQRSGRKPRVAVVFGGQSGEHEISCATAAGVLGAIDRERYDVIPVAIAPDGQWLLVSDQPENYALRPDGSGVTISEEEHGLARVALSMSGGLLTVTFPDGHTQDYGQVDVVFPLLHGPGGEDGTIQGMLDLLGVRYVGCGVLASAAAMDKQVTKIMLTAAGIPTAPYVAVNDERWLTDRAAVLDACQALDYPVFVKPSRAGSSLGITKVDRREDLEKAIEIARTVDPKVLVESGIVGREIEVAVLAGHEPGQTRVAPPGEIVMDASQGAGEFYDYETKYVAHDAVSMVCPAPMENSERDLLMRTAARAFAAIDGEGLARVDFFLTNQGAVIVNEINTMPGFTPFSMYPYMWQVGGLDYSSLVSELIDLALERPLSVNR